MRLKRAPEILKAVDCRRTPLVRKIGSLRLPRQSRCSFLAMTRLIGCTAVLTFVIARSEATWAARERRRWTSSNRRQRRRKGAKKLAPHLQAGSAEAFSIGLRLGRRLPWRKRSAAGRLSANPEESSDRGGWAGTWFCTSKAQGKTLVPTRKSQGSWLP